MTAVLLFNRDIPLFDIFVVEHGVVRMFVLDTRAISRRVQYCTMIFQDFV